MNEIIDNISAWFEEYPAVLAAIEIAGVLLLAIVVYFITERVVLRMVEKLIKRTKTELDDILFNRKIFKRLSLIAPVIIIHQFAYVAPAVEGFILRLANALIALFIIMAVGTLAGSIATALQRTERYRNRPIKGYIQVIMIVIYVMGGIFIAGILTGQQPWALIGSLSALTAIILLIFRDTILSFVASIQITSYDLVKVGDWIEVSKFGADGDVIDISLNVIKVQNWDKTITVIPTYKLIEESFKNWRGMQLTGGRRIKRAIYIDQASIDFLDNKSITEYKNIRLLKSYLDKKEEELNKYNREIETDKDATVGINGRRLTNVGTFRAYIKEYLRSRKDIHKNLTFLVRQLEPGPQGLPIEIYVFTTTTAWVEYEDIQADIFDHILSVVPQFGLRLFQNPSGSDLREVIKEGKQLTEKPEPKQSKEKPEENKEEQ